MSVAESDLRPLASIDIVPISDAMGAEVRIDPARPMDPATRQDELPTKQGIPGAPAASPPELLPAPALSAAGL